MFDMRKERIGYYCFFGLMHGKTLVEAMLEGDQRLLDDILLFLEDDLLTYGMGRLKNMIWKYFIRCSLSEANIARLEHAAFNRLKRPMTPEFRNMCKCMCHFARPEFWVTVEDAMHNSADPVVRITASYLLPYRDGLAAGWVKNPKKHPNRLTWPSSYKKPYTPNLAEMPTKHISPELSTLMAEPDNWIDGKVVRKAPIAGDCPILPLYGFDELDFATLDLSFCKSAVVIPKLALLMDEHYRDLVLVISAIYLLYRINDPTAVPVLIDFYERRIADRFPNYAKEYLQVAVFKALKSYATSLSIEFMSTQHELSIHHEDKESLINGDEDEGYLLKYHFIYDKVGWFGA